MRKEPNILDKVHTDRAGYRPVGEGVGNVGPVVWQSSLDVKIHAASGLENSPFTPSFLFVEAV